ncbi:MAG: hypothetical protein PF542_02595 [Nanoarchaeota archaeon]|jgi:hypothetical protein|nr:hypothetical protein [Nanoarchaeota archaeon]
MKRGFKIFLIFLMIALIIGTFFIFQYTGIKKGGKNKVENVDRQLKAEIDQLFADEGRTIAVRDSDGKI